MPSEIYPDVVQLRRMPSGLAPMPLFITSYCFRPWSPGHAATSSMIASEGLKPSDLFAENAIFFTAEFVPGIARSLCRCLGSIESSFTFVPNGVRSENSSFRRMYSGSSCVIIQTSLYTRSAWSSLGATQNTFAPKPPSSLHV